MEERYTIKQVLQMTYDLLAISVPVDLCDQIGMPVAQARANIAACIRSIEQNEEKQAEDGEEVAEDGEADAE